MTDAWKSRATGAALIVLVTAVVYLPVLRGGFIFDDALLITNNSIVKASNGLYRFWFTKDAPYYHPLTWSLCWLEWHLWGGQAAGYHVVNVILHAVNAVLVWLVLRDLRISGAWLAALLFAVHPVNVATAAWISEQKNTLSMLFFAVSILMYLKFDETVYAELVLGPSATLRINSVEWQRVPSVSMYVLSLLAFGLALLSKTAVVMLPVVLLGCLWWRHGQVRKNDLLRSAPFFILSLLSGFVTVWFESRALTNASAEPVALSSRLLAAGRAPWFYLSKALVPIDLTMIYPRWEIDPAHWTSYLPGLILVGCFVVFWLKRTTWGHPLLFGFGYFIVMLVPVLGFFDQGFFQQSFVADHWQYYSIVGVIALAVAAGERIGRAMGDPGGSRGRMAGAVIVLLLGLAAWNRNCLYANATALWQDNVAKSPSSWGAYNNLGDALAGRGRMLEAAEAFEQALQINPGFPRAHYNLGNVLMMLGSSGDAVAHWEQAVWLKPDFVEAHYNLGVTLMAMGRTPEAIGHLEQALRLRPDSAETLNSLATALSQVGRMDEAIARYEEALRLAPGSAEYHHNLGIALFRQGRLPEAVAECDQALRLNPAFARVHLTLGVVLTKMGRVQEAIGHYREALRLQPSLVEARTALSQLEAASPHK